MGSLVTYTFSLDGEKHKARVVRVGHENTAIIELDDKTFKVAFPKDFSFEKSNTISVDCEQFKVKPERGRDSVTFSAEVNGKQFVLRLNVESKKPRIKTSKLVVHKTSPERVRRAIGKRGVVSALMPGKVVLIKVKSGDRVKAGDPICVLEAMKMENEIVAPIGGTISLVKVGNDSFVNKGDTLVLIEDESENR
ncbi:MAG: biotin/lipoyl-binding protein [Candidatus Bathyarchaeota archaeon]|nr:biotin/lipoyl-binding protein [Candidatus Bathyarchaeota archaeon]